MHMITRFSSLIIIPNLHQSGEIKRNWGQCEGLTTGTGRLWTVDGYTTVGVSMEAGELSSGDCGSAMLVWIVSGWVAVTAARCCCWDDCICCGCCCWTGCAITAVATLCKTGTAPAACCKQLIYQQLCIDKVARTAQDQYFFFNCGSTKSNCKLIREYLTFKSLNTRLVTLHNEYTMLSVSRCYCQYTISHFWGSRSGY